VAYTRHRSPHPQTSPEAILGYGLCPITVGKFWHITRLLLSAHKLTKLMQIADLAFDSFLDLVHWRHCVVTIKAEQRQSFFSLGRTNLVGDMSP